MKSPFEPRVGEKWRHKRLPDSHAEVVRTGRAIGTGWRQLTLRWSNGHEETVYMRGFLKAWERAPEASP